MSMYHYYFGMKEKEIEGSETILGQKLTELSQKKELS